MKHVQKVISYKRSFTDCIGLRECTQLVRKDFALQEDMADVAFDKQRLHIHPQKY